MNVSGEASSETKQGVVYENVAIFNFIKKLFNVILFQGIRVRPISVDK